MNDAKEVWRSAETPQRPRQETLAERVARVAPVLLRRFETASAAPERPDPGARSPRLSSLLACLVERLAETPEEKEGSPTAAPPFHRAVQETTESLPIEEAVAEFRVLRRFLLETLEAEAPLFPAERDRILDCFEEELARVIAQHVAATHGARVQLLSEIGRQLLFSDEPRVFIEQLFAKLGRHLDLEIYINYLVDPSGTGLQLASYAGIPNTFAVEIAHLKFGQEICGTVARERRPIVAEDLPHSADPLTSLLRSLGITAYACYPLIADERLIGTLSFGTRRRRAFQPEELTLIRSVCDQAAVALERARLTAELHARAHALAEADCRKNEFLAMLAHELRNPIAGIASATQVLNLLDGDDPSRRRLRAAITRQTSHLARMVDDLLEISRITQRKIELRKAIVDFTAIVQQAIEAMRPFIDARRHELQVSLPEERLPVVGDPTRLEQVITNLLNNAVKYTDPGGCLSITLARAEGAAVVRVRDTGIGITAELLPRVFDLFTQADRSLNRAEGGLGIGLTLAKQLVEMHGGSIEAFSEGPGRGSAFTVRLPIAIEASAPPPPAEPEECRMRPLRVLLVEDNEDAAETMAELLGLWGHMVRVVYNGPEAIRVTQEFRPEVVLLDIGLPGMDGFQVVRLLREQPETRGALIAALTGYGQQEDRRRSREAGFDRHLVKPVPAEELSALLASIGQEREAGA